MYQLRRTQVAVSISPQYLLPHRPCLVSIGPWLRAVRELPRQLGQRQVDLFQTFSQQLLASPQLVDLLLPARVDCPFTAYL
jgi:hypothetical protein